MFVSTDCSIDQFDRDSFDLLFIDHSSFSFRFLRPGDQSEVKSLCEQWFPLEYSPTWYDEITVDEKYFALAAFDRPTKRIIGLLVALLVPLKTSSHYDQTILSRSFFSNGTMCYVLVLGVLNDFRRQGLASLLLQQLYHNVDRYSNCHAIYLHVLHSNRSAIEFYRSQQFQCHQHLRRFYTIKNELFDAFCFVRYFHSKEENDRLESVSIFISHLDGYPPRTFNDLLITIQRTVLGRTFVQLIMKLKSFLMHLCFSDR